MGLRSGLSNLGPPRCCVADLATPIQLAPAAQQPKSKSAHQPPRSYRGQPVEAPHLGCEPSRITRRNTSCRVALWQSTQSQQKRPEQEPEDSPVQGWALTGSLQKRREQPQWPPPPFRQCSAGVWALGSSKLGADHSIPSNGGARWT